MKVGLLQEAIKEKNSDVRFLEMVDEAMIAEQAGFAFYGCSEQHFARYVDLTINERVGETAVGGPEEYLTAFAVPTPEAFLAYIAGRTSTLRIRTMATVFLPPINHPVRVAEWLSTLDLITGGRVELGGARSNNVHTLRAFGIEPSETSGLRDEFLACLGAALTQDPFEFHSEHFDVPPRSVSPKPVQKPFPPVYLAATGIKSHQYAGSRGVGVMTGNTILGWEYAADCIAAYKEAVEEADPVLGETYKANGVAVLQVNCAPSMREAKEQAERIVFYTISRMIQLYSGLAKESPDYAYLGGIEKIRAHARDLDYLLDCAPYFMVGTPDVLIEKLKRLESIGAEEVILRIDGLGHEGNRRAIELIGKEVIPAVA